MKVDLTEEEIKMILFAVDTYDDQLDNADLQDQEEEDALLNDMEMLTNICVKLFKAIGLDPPAPPEV